MSLSRKIRCLYILVLLAASAVAWPQSRADGGPSAKAGPRIWAIELETDDLDRSVDFYSGALGFRVERRDPSGKTVEMRNGEARLLLSLTDAPPAPAGTAGFFLNMSVGDLRTASRKAVSHGGHLVDREARTSPVGSFLEIHDPFGHPVHLIDHPWDEMAAEDRPAVYNYGMHVRSIEEDEPFMTSLGLQVETRDYLPDTLVFKRQGIGYLVMHPGAERACEPGRPSGALILAGEHPAALTELRAPSGALVKLRAD